MGTMSVRKLGGLSLIVGPIVAVACFLIRPGGGLVGDYIDPANSAAAIGALITNASSASISFTLGALGLIILLYGVRALVSSMEGTNGHALARYGSLFLLFATVAWVTASALALVISSLSAPPEVFPIIAGTVYATVVGLNLLGSLLGALAFLAIGYAASTNENFNKPFALIVAIVSAVLVVVAVISANDLSQLQNAQIIGAVGYIITTVWGITIGLKMMK
jgi:hypothetical protein